MSRKNAPGRRQKSRGTPTLPDPAPIENNSSISAGVREKRGDFAAGQALTLTKRMAFLLSKVTLADR